MSKSLHRYSLVSLLLKIIVFISVVVGVYLSWAGGRNAFMGGGSVFMFFTIQSNIAIALICLCGLILLLTRKTAGHAEQIIKLVGTVSITLTGMVFCFVLAPTMGDKAWGAANVLTHVVVPVLAVADFFVVGHQYDYRKKDALWVIVPPLLYVIYAGIGYVSGWEFMPGINYPYFFLNWGSPAGAFGFSKDLPYMGCAWWILLLLVFLLAVGLLYLRVTAVIRKRCNSRRAQ